MLVHLEDLLAKVIENTKTHKLAIMQLHDNDKQLADSIMELRVAVNALAAKIEFLEGNDNDV